MGGAPGANRKQGCHPMNVHEALDEGRTGVCFRRNLVHTPEAAEEFWCRIHRTPEALVLEI